MVEKEAQKSQSNTSSMMTNQTYNHEKYVIQYPPQPKPSYTLDALMKSAEMKRSLALMRSVVEAQEAASSPPAKKQRVKYLVH